MHYRYMYNIKRIHRKHPRAVFSGLKIIIKYEDMLSCRMSNSGSRTVCIPEYCAHGKACTPILVNIRRINLFLSPPNVVENAVCATTEYAAKGSKVLGRRLYNRTYQRLSLSKSEYFEIIFIFTSPKTRACSFGWDTAARRGASSCASASCSIKCTYYVVHLDARTVHFWRGCPR